MSLSVGEGTFTSIVGAMGPQIDTSQHSGGADDPDAGRLTIDAVLQSTVSAATQRSSSRTTRFCRGFWHLRTCGSLWVRRCPS